MKAERDFSFSGMRDCPRRAGSLYLAGRLEVVGVDPVDAEIEHGLPDLVARKPRPTGES